MSVVVINLACIGSMVVIRIVGSQSSDINCEYGGHQFVSLACHMDNE